MLLNFELPDSSGLELILAIRQRHAALPVLVLSRQCWIEVKLTALALGANDFIMRPWEPADVLARLRAMCRRDASCGDDEICLGPLRLHQTDRQASVNGLPVALSAREFDMLALLVASRGSVVAQQTLWQHLYQGVTPVSGEILSGFICSLRRKLEQAGCPAMIGTSQGRGYLLAARETPADGAPRQRTATEIADHVHGW